jgi:VIT1/CCC1 family predicted Fe2+/Mn2+ transporter
VNAPGKQHAALFRPAIFGLADGCMSLLGVILYLHAGLASVVFLSALMGGISSAISMAGSEFMSDDGKVMPSVVMGVATGAGGILPAIPYALTSGRLALVLCSAIVLLIGALVAILRVKTSTAHGWLYTAVVTFAILGAIFGVVLACTLIFPSPGG